MSHLSSAWDISPPYQCHRRILDRNINCLRSFDRIFLYLGMTQVRRQGADQSVMWSSSDHDRHDRHPLWSSSVTRGFALDLRKPHRKKNRMQLLLHLCVAVTTFKNTTTMGVSISFVILLPLSLFGWSRDTTSLMCLKIDTSPPFSAKG